MAKTTTQYSVALGEKDFWQVFDGEFPVVTFLSQQDAEDWCIAQNLEYTVK